MILGKPDPAVLPVLTGGLVPPPDWNDAVECLQGRTPLLWAIERASLNMVALLLSRGADCVNLDNLLVSALMGHCLMFPCCGPTPHKHAPLSRSVHAQRLAATNLVGGFVAQG